MSYEACKDLSLAFKAVPIEDLRMLVQPLLTWYDNHARILPWRTRPTPYRVWISEIMLQQTRVETVVPYFERFMAALPDVETLAAADEGALLKLWEGLGYYARARNLQKAACVVMRRYNGVLPASYEQLLELPGIGEYSAGAIEYSGTGGGRQCIAGAGKAFGQPGRYCSNTGT